MRKKQKILLKGYKKQEKFKEPRKAFSDSGYVN
jgi:hypothetical protein